MIIKERIIFWRDHGCVHQEHQQSSTIASNFHSDAKDQRKTNQQQPKHEQPIDQRTACDALEERSERTIGAFCQETDSRGIAQEPSLIRRGGEA